MGRVTLQRQVDRTLGEIDTLASTTSLDAQALGLPGAPATARGSAGFPAIGMSALGITDLDVRSPDEAFGTMRLLDRALTRLGATRISLDGATARFERQLTDLTHPPRTASGDAALAGSTAALTSAVRTSEQLRTRSGEAQSVQTVPSAARVRSTAGVGRPLLAPRYRVKAGRGATNNRLSGRNWVQPPAMDVTGLPLTCSSPMAGTRFSPIGSCHSRNRA